MSFMVPEPRAAHALAAMEEGSFYGDDQSEFGDAAGCDHGAADVVVPYDDGAAGDAQRFAAARNEEDQADARVLQYIVERIHPPVAAAVRNGKRRRVKAPDKSGAVSLG